MKNNHYEYKDYELIERSIRKAESLLRSKNKDAFTYITHNLFDVINVFDSSFAIKVYNNFKQFQINLIDNGDEGVYEKAIIRFDELLSEYLHNIVVDLNEHHGVN